MLLVPHGTVAPFVFVLVLDDDDRFSELIKRLQLACSLLLLLLLPLLLLGGSDAACTGTSHRLLTDVAAIAIITTCNRP